MKVVEIWCKAKALNGAFDVLLDVSGRVCDLRRPLSKNIKPALGRNYTNVSPWVSVIDRSKTY